jgi:N-acetylglutamate synthase
MLRETMDHDLAWRLEELYTAAWPPLRQETIGDWLLKFAPGVSRRANSANPRQAQIRDVEGSIAECERRYRDSGMPALFRIPSIIEPAAGVRLERLGYRPEGETVNLYASIDDAVARRDKAVTILPHPDAEWLAAMTAAQGHTGDKAQTYHQVVSSIAIPAAFVSLRQDDALAALAYGALDGGVMCFESVVTLERYRGRGLAHRALSALIDWAAQRGAQAVCLQVEATNERGTRLYHSLGLRQELYRYDYRREPDAAPYIPAWRGAGNSVS